MVRRTIASAAIVASLAAGSLSALALLLNPELPFVAELPSLALSLFLPWAAGGTLALSLAAGLAAASRTRPQPSRPVVSGRPYYCLLSFLALSAVAGVYWQNLVGYRHAVPIASVHALAASAVVATAAAASFLAIGLDLALYPHHTRAPAAVLAVLAPAATVVVPLALRPVTPRPEPPAPTRLANSPAVRRVYVVGIDGLSPADVAGDPAEARVPWLARLARRGALAPLATVQPTEAAAVWSTLMTGVLPRVHGVRSAFSYRLLGSGRDWPLLPKAALVGWLERARLVSRRPITSAARERRALWNVLDAFGIASGLVRVAGTHPPEAVLGFAVSPYFHLLPEGDPRLAGSLHPRELLAEAAAGVVAAEGLDPALLRALADPPPGATSPLADPLIRRLAAEALAPDLSYERVADVLRRAYAPAFFVAAFHGYDQIGHEFYRYAHAEAFGDVDPELARRYGRVLDGYAVLVGRWVTKLEKELQPGDLLIVISGHGLAPTPLWRRLLGTLTGTEVTAATHAGAPPGVLVAVGDPIRPGSRVRRASILDVAPTLLYLLGLPVARDMEGRVLTELVEPSFAGEHPVTFIPSYQSLAVTPVAAGAPSDDLPDLPDEQP